jgi:hypothetical protein
MERHCMRYATLSPRDRAHRLESWKLLLSYPFWLSRWSQFLEAPQTAALRRAGQNCWTCLLDTNEASYFGLAHASFERGLSPLALLAVTTKQ